MIHRPGLANRPRARRWLRFLLALGAIIVVATAYGTLQDMASKHGATDDAEAARVLQSYYRATDLPDGWVVGKIQRVRPGSFVVNLHFSPRVNDPRYGRPAPDGAIKAANACPRDPEPFHHAGILTLRLRTNDKNGVIDDFACPAVSAPLSPAPDRKSSAG